MANSHDINYTIRPAKGAERKMIVELCTRLSLFRPLIEYQYVGYGGAYFCDFTLFHRALNISEMISIEEDANGPTRYEFNKPYECVKIESGAAHTIFPELKWTKPSIVWMDETCTLTATVLNVMLGAIRELPSGSLVILTVNNSGLKNGQGEKGMRGELKQRLAQFTPDLEDDELAGPKLQMRLFRVVCDAAQGILDKRNLGKAKEEHLIFVPVLNVEYKDGAKMSTFGGIILTVAEKNRHLDSFLKGLPFVSRPTDKKPFEIVAPNLSLKEVRRLNECLPGGDLNSCQKETGLPMEHIQAYSKIYRYYINLAEIIA